MQYWLYLNYDKKDEYINIVRSFPIWLIHVDINDDLDKVIYIYINTVCIYRLFLYSQKWPKPAYPIFFAHLFSALGG